MYQFVNRHSTVLVDGKGQRYHDSLNLSGLWRVSHYDLYAVMVGDDYHLVPIGVKRFDIGQRYLIPECLVKPIKRQLMAYLETLT